MVWMLAFVGGSIKASIPSILQVKATSSTFASSVNKSDLPASSSDPIQMPEESAFLIAELDDQADDDKKLVLPFFYIQFNGLKLSTEIQIVRSFHFKQAIQQILPIPLFVLHHSWKSYLI